MKLSARNILKITRLYKLADDNTSVKQLRQLDVVDEESFVRVSFIFNKSAYGILFRSMIDLTRSEERRVGKECRSRWSPYH